jgi:hypothetical protein
MVAASRRAWLRMAIALAVRFFGFGLHPFRCPARLRFFILTHRRAELGEGRCDCG